MKRFFLFIEDQSSRLKDLSLLFIRFILAYGFWEPAKMKWSDIHSVADWFGSIGIPAPLFSAYLAATTEMLGVFLLVIGLFTRLISIPLMITMLVAIFAVHWANGFASSENGFEIPLYYFLMLFVLLGCGPGKFSIDHVLQKKFRI